MRPDILTRIFAPIGKLPGIGPKMVRLYDRLTGRGEAGARIIDLCFIYQSADRPPPQPLHRCCTARRYRDIGRHG